MITAAILLIMIGFSLLQVGCTLKVGGHPARFMPRPLLNRGLLLGLLRTDIEPSTVNIIILSPMFTSTLEAGYIFTIMAAGGRHLCRFHQGFILAQENT